MADQQQAKVTFTSLNAALIVPAHRVLHLTPRQPKISIGRASKCASKCLVAATDNAWFDSPVMSRSHAEILLHSDNKTLQLLDVGSMHGTVLNDQELQEQEPRSLNNGDVVKFGAEVRRGAETFPPCAIKIEYEFSPYKAAESGKTYKYLESSDEANYSEEEDMSEITGSPPNEGVIDNTSSESPASRRSLSVEIVGSSSGPKGLTEDQAELDILRMKKASLSDFGNAANPLVVDSDDDQDTDDEIEVEELDADEMELDAELGVAVKLELEEESSDRSDNHSDREDSVQHDMPVRAIVTPESAAEAEGSSEVIVEEVRRLSDNKGIKISNVRSTQSIDLWALEAEDTSESDSDNESEDEDDVMPKLAVTVARRGGVINLEDSESESELSEDSEDNDSVDSVDGEVGVSYEASEPDSEAVGLEESDLDTSSDEDSVLGFMADFNKAASKYEIMKRALPLENEKDAAANIVSLPVMASWSGGISYVPNVDVIGKASFAREPSPSDAAMVKEDIVTPAFGYPFDAAITVNPSQVDRDLAPVVPRPAQSMDETGKAEFFEAREGNRLHIANRAELAEHYTKRTPHPIGLVRIGSVIRGGREQGPGQQGVAQPVSSYPQAQFPLPAFSSWLEEPLKPAQQPQPQRIQDQTQAQQQQHRSQDQIGMLRQAAMMTENLNRLRQHQIQRFEAHSTARPGQMNLPSLSKCTAGRPAFHTTPPLKKLPVPAPLPGNSHVTRSSVPISDLVEQNPHTPGPSQSNKRKADAISSSRNDDLPTQASTGDQMSGSGKSTSGQDVGGTESETNLPSRSAPAPLTETVEPFERAPKRMRRFVEAVGYAALGGAAVGAGLFSVLVATAPDFL